MICIVCLFYYLNVVFSGMFYIWSCMRPGLITRPPGGCRQSALSYVSGHYQHSTYAKTIERNEVASSVFSYWDGKKESPLWSYKDLKIPHNPHQLCMQTQLKNQNSGLSSCERISSNYKKMPGGFLPKQLEM